MTAILFAVYFFVTGALQVLAFIKGIDLWLGWHWIAAVAIFLLATYIPLGFLATVAIAFYGAWQGWHWPIWQVMLFVFPFAVVSTIAGLMGMFGATVDYVRGR